MVVEQLTPPAGLCLSTKLTNTFPLELSCTLANDSCCIIFPPNGWHFVGMYIMMISMTHSPMWSIVDLRLRSCIILLPYAPNPQKQLTNSSGTKFHYIIVVGMIGYGASLGRPQCYTHSPISGLSRGTCLHRQQVTMTRRDHNTQHKHTTNTTTMVVEPPTPLVVWIWWIDTAWGADALAHIFSKAAIEGFI